MGTRSFGVDRPLLIACVTALLLVVGCSTASDLSQADTTAPSTSQPSSVAPSSTDASITVEPAAPSSSVPEEQQEPASAEMPDLIGLSESEARDVLADNAIDGPTVEERPSFEAPGTVIDQVPSAGRVVSGTVSVVVSVAFPPMPDFVGEDVSSVRKWTDELDIDLRIEERLTIESADGTVLEQIPVANSEVGRELAIVVADEPLLVFLAEFEGRLDSLYYDIETIDMNGVTYTNTPTLSKARSSRTAAGWVSYNLSRDWQTLVVQLGIDDSAGSLDAASKIEFRGDGELLEEATVRFGEVVEVEVDVSGVLRLEIIRTNITGVGQIGLGYAQLISGANS